MIIKQEESFKPVTITLETKEEYQALVAIVDEASGADHDDREYMGEEAGKVAIELSDFFSNNV